jgi:hypothetical protein
MVCWPSCMKTVLGELVPLEQKAHDREADVPAAPVTCIGVGIAPSVA